MTGSRLRGTTGPLAGTLLAAALAGCATPGGSTSTGATGAARDLGPTSQLVTGYIGQQMTEQDRGRVRLALEDNGNYQSTTWQGAQGRVAYKVTPIRTFSSDGSTRCRDFDTQATIDGRHQKIRGTACRQPDGSWRPLTD
jgi:surface antigen